MSENVTFMVGNGFNFFVSNYIGSPKYNRKIKEKATSTGIENVQKWILECRKILNEYCHLFDAIALSDNQDTGEFLLAQLSDFLATINADQIMETIENAISAKINNQMQHANYSSEVPDVPITVRTCFKIKEDKKFIYFSSAIKTLFQKFEIGDLHLYTTNYDGIVKQVFQCGKENKALDNIHYIPLHGEAKAMEEDDEKAILCTAPTLKEEVLKQMPKGKQYLSNLVNDLKLSSVVVLFGLGLKTDPHILKRLNKCKNKIFIIIEASAEDYIDRNYDYEDFYEHIHFDFLKQNQVYFINTKKPTLQDNQKMKSPIETPEALLTAIENILMTIQKEK